MKFAKLFEFEDIGQILVKIGDSAVGDDETTEHRAPEGTERTELRFYFQPPGLGLCEFAFDFEDDEDWTKATHALNITDESAVRELYESLAAHQLIKTFAQDEQ